MGRQVAVFGTGYQGATHGACMAELGHDVPGVDIDEGNLAKLAAGELPFFEPGLSEVLRRNIDAGRLRFTTSYEETAEFETLGPFLADPAAVFGKSTVPTGTAARLGARVREVAPARDQADLAWSPEFSGKASR